MIPFSKKVRIFVFNQAVDVIKQHSGLAAIVQSTMNLDILTGCLFVFMNKSRRILKGLFWDNTGLVILHKKIEEGNFMNVFVYDDILEIGPGEFSILFEGSYFNVRPNKKSFFGLGHSRNLM